METNKKVIYERQIPMQPIFVRLTSEANDGHYSDPLLREKHRMIKMEIEESAWCSPTNQWCTRKNSAAYSIKDQQEMWRAVIEVIVYSGEKKRKIKLLRDLANELEQGELNT